MHDIDNKSGKHRVWFVSLFRQDQKIIYSSFIIHYYTDYFWNKVKLGKPDGYDLICNLRNWR